MSETVASDKLKVFISYSRRDLDFADQLVAILTWLGFQPSIDRKGIHGAEKWEQRLGQLILEADIIVFVLSPDSAASDVCAWEVEEAIRRGKRIIPVLSRPLDGRLPHQQLRELNYIHFYADKDVPGSGFGTGQVRLIEALSVDVEWLRSHTRIEELAARWDESNRDSDLLVRGSELEACNSWRDRRPSNAPELTTLQRVFLAASEEGELARANTERRQLEKIAAAQADRQTAIEEREAAVSREVEALRARALSRRIITWGSATGAALIVIAALTFAGQQQRNSAKQAILRAEAETERSEAVHQRNEADKHTALAQAQKATVDELIRRIRVGGSNVHGITAMKKICSEATSVTSRLANTLSEDEYADSELLFWELYYGPMNLIELRQRTNKYAGDSNDIISSPIETAMVVFGRKLENQQTSESDFPRTALWQFSLNIEAQCESYLP